MTILANQLLQQALQLPIADREQIADQLYLSLHSPEEIESAWGDEIAGRIAQVDNEEVALVSPEEVHRQVRQVINRERPAS